MAAQDEGAGQGAVLTGVTHLTKLRCLGESQVSSKI